MFIYVIFISKKKEKTSSFRSRWHMRRWRFKFFRRGGGGGSDGVFSRGVFCRLFIFSFIPCEFYEIDIFQAGKKSEPPLDQHMYIIDLYRYAWKKSSGELPRPSQFFSQPTFFIKFT